MQSICNWFKIFIFFQITMSMNVTTDFNITEKFTTILFGKITFCFTICFQKPKPQLKQRRLSSKKNSLAGQSEMSSDGSNSSRKENVPPELMICIDMNTGGEDSAGSDHRTYRYYVVHAHFLPFLVALGQIRPQFL